jgi:uncharacterized protein YdhG (YjbR/CyaY superfamily)
MAKAAPTPRTNTVIDQIAPEKRVALEALAKAIRKAAPKTVESETYGARGFRMDGMPVVAIGASARALSFYVMSLGVMARFAEEFEALGFGYSKGTVQFSADKPLPASLVGRIVKARLSENAKLREARKPKAKTARGKK